MTDSPEFFDSDDYLIDDPNSPFYGLPRGEVDTVPDASSEVLEDVLDRLGVDDFDGIIVDFQDVNVENLRGNRFVSLSDALVYLHEAGILSFGSATINDEGEIGVEIEGSE